MGKGNICVQHPPTFPFALHQLQGPPTPNLTRTQLRAPQATTNTMAHSVPEGLEPQVSICSRRKNIISVQESETMTNSGSLWRETLRTCSHQNHQFSEHWAWPCGPLWGHSRKTCPTTRAHALYLTVRVIKTGPADLCSLTAQLPSTTFLSSKGFLLGPAMLLLGHFLWGSSHSRPHPSQP